MTSQTRDGQTRNRRNDAILARSPSRPASDVAFTPAVKAQQERRGSRAAYERMERKGGWERQITADLVDFIAERDSFYLASATAEGQPTIQHRGGAKGFLKVLDARTLGFADFSGNRQYITFGNLSENDRVQLFLMDYAGRRRSKIWGRARVVEDDPPLLERLTDPDTAEPPERAIVVHVEAWDVNCPKHIVRRFDEAQLAQQTVALRRRVAELERALAEARAPA